MKIVSVTDLVDRDTGGSPSLENLADFLRSKGYHVTDLCGETVIVDGRSHKCRGPKGHKMAHEIDMHHHG